MRFLSLSLCALFIFFATPVWAEGQAKNPEIVDYDFDHETELAQTPNTAKLKTEPSEAPLSQPVKKNTPAVESGHAAEQTHTAMPAPTVEPLHATEAAHTSESTHAAMPAATAEPLHTTETAQTSESNHTAMPAATAEPLHATEAAHTIEQTPAAKAEKTSAPDPCDTEADLKKGQVIDGVLTIIDEPAPDKSTEEDLLDSLFAPTMEAQQEVNLTPHQTEPTTKVPAKEGEAKVELAENAPAKAVVARKVEARTVKSASTEYQFWAMSSKNWNYNIKRYYTANQSLTPNRPLYAIDKVGFPSGRALNVNSIQLSPQVTKSYSSDGRVLEISKFPRLR